MIFIVNDVLSVILPGKVLQQAGQNESPKGLAKLVIKSN